ncbi:MAG: hypothetical protein U5K75_08605 [Ahrensia sp.]|nr:hypothetical protein [Ahrensia sp.]
MRLDAVKAELRGYLEPNTHLIICPQKCPNLIEGFEGKYRYKRRPNTASATYEDQPEKNHPHSDLHDALQYLVLGIRGRVGALRGAAGLKNDSSSTGFSGQSAWSNQSSVKSNKGGLMFTVLELSVSAR